MSTATSDRGTFLAEVLRLDPRLHPMDWQGLDWEDAPPAGRRRVGCVRMRAPRMRLGALAAAAALALALVLYLTVGAVARRATARRGRRRRHRGRRRASSASPWSARSSTAGSPRRRCCATSAAPARGRSRLPFTWATRAAHPRAPLDWTFDDRAVAAAARAGLEVQAVLAQAPVWARRRPSEPWSPPRSPEAFAGWAAAAVARYGSPRHVLARAPRRPEAPHPRVAGLERARRRELARRAAASSGSTTGPPCPPTWRSSARPRRRSTGPTPRRRSCSRA